MKICYLADGGSIHTQRWCKHFYALGHEIHLITFKEVQIENIQVHYINAGVIDARGGNWKILLAFPTVKNLIAEIKPDILHAHYATSYGIVGALSKFHPYVVTVLGSDVLISPKRSKIYRFLVKYVLRKADWVLASAFFMKEEILALGIDATKIHIAVFGIDPTIFNMEARLLPENKFVITSTRNFEQVYNIPMIIKAVAKAKESIPNLELNILGAGSMKREVEEMVLTKGIFNQTNFLGKLSQIELAEVLKKSHLFLSASYSDSNNVSINEAMACGAFPIATDIPANQHWIKDGENGFLVPVDDADAMAEKIVEAYQKYDQLMPKAAEINKAIIEEQAIWSQNMEAVKDKYYKLAFLAS